MAARRAGLLAALALALLAGGAVARTSGPTPTAPPSISGTAKAGARLAAETGTWTSATAVEYAYQWYRCDAAGARCSSIHGATGPGLSLSRKDVGHTIGLTVTASDGTGSSSAYASLVGPIAARMPLLVSTAQPVVVGTPVEGRLLQVTTGAWSPAPASVAYSWRRCNPNGRVCTPIPGADAGAYTVSAADAGHALVALVVGAFGSARQGALSTASLPAVGGDAAGPARSAPPQVAGLAAVGARLAGSAGVWSGVGPLAYAYQWYRCDPAGSHCASIHGATTSTYRTVRADAGKTLGLAVRATDSTGTAAGYSNLAGPIAPAGAALVAAAAPGLSGSPHPGATLTAGPGSWRPDPDRISYEWRRCNPNGRVCSPVEGATRDSYLVTGADAGHALVAVVTARAGPASQAAYSAASQPVR